MTASPIIEGRFYLYVFDFLKFRNRAEETIRPVNVFHCQGVCWKFRFAGEIRVYVNGKLVMGVIADQLANGYTLPMPVTLKVEDELCIQVTDVQRRWFRWFRPNTAHVTLEGLEECAP